MIDAAGEKKRGDTDSAAPIDCDAKVISSGDDGVGVEVAGRRCGNFLHPWSGVVILGLDWILFSGNLFAPGVAMLLNVLIGFLVGGVGTVFCQRRFGHDSRAGSLIKGILGGILVGIPYPIVGTVAGAAILTLSGLGAMKDKALADAARTVLPKSDSDTTPKGS